MADDRSESLREFADIIQEKAAPMRDEHREPASGSPGPGSDSGRGERSPVAGGASGLRSMLDRQPRAAVAGMAAGIGVAIGYLIGKITRK